MILTDATSKHILNIKITMKVLLINGSPRKQGNTYTALNEIAQQLNKQGVRK